MDLMLDLETLSTAPNAYILSIGAVPFDSNHIGEKFYAVPSLPDSEELIGRIDAETVLWWFRQSQSARDTFIQPHRPQDLQSCLSDLSNFYRSHNCERVWAHPSSFDLPILQTAYQACHMVPAWHKREWRDARTLFQLIPGGKESLWPRPLPLDFILHHAAWDAWAQAYAAQEALKRLGATITH